MAIIKMIFCGAVLFLIVVGLIHVVFFKKKKQWENPLEKEFHDFF